jgi:hypothetical protein
MVVSESVGDITARWIAMAREWVEIDGFGPLHIVVEDGNCEDEHIEWCLSSANSAARPLTDAERSFATRLLNDFQEEERFAICYLADHAALAPAADGGAG